jgi:hypothetical protein
MQFDLALDINAQLSEQTLNYRSGNYSFGTLLLILITFVQLPMISYARKGLKSLDSEIDSSS